MKIKELLRGIEYKSPSSFSGDIEIKGIACDSKAVNKDYLFIAVAGTKTDGHKFANEALERGAVAVVIEREIPLDDGIAKIYVKDSRAALARIANEFYGRPAEKLRCVGITGTNGKTTISYLMDSIVSAAGHKAGLIGTINYRIGERIIPAVNTTPGPVELYNFMSKMLQNSIDHLVMEVSSHSLDQRRVEGIGFAAAIFTNLTGDHLDYHKTMEGYFEAKAKLFEGLDSGSYGIINIDDEWGRKLLRRSKGRVMTYGTKQGADFLAGGIELSLNGTGFIIDTPDGRVKIDTKLIGLHNVYNITASVAAGAALGFSPEAVKRGIENVRAVPGRLEEIDCGQPFKVFVDYAHTDDALCNVLSALRPLISERIIVVFGCGGDRDKTKRPRMGKVAGKLADLVIVTSDNPRGEDPKTITDEIVAGIGSANYRVIVDRMQAIGQALSAARDGDCVLIAGKGHETYQVLKNTTVAFDDREVARKILCSTQKIS
ncbi:MAG: UDP-N-acetylmuramoyl-L-alanyl-D-glutamate--2,6-diaminopimelate ligase [Candidatus Omnitrophota bacterium]|nr:UDP-N-acetylmuramoyl-L-alanyl-D-glutamate--2,6-diaminopimelate ligase [Candidatus Omnitrophota bacterium]